MTRYDVVIVGGGVAGLSAGIFTARADLDTLVVNDGVSILYRNAILENFPGFPAGIDSRLFSLMLEEQAERAGCARLDAKVSDVRCADADDECDGFSVETGDETIDAERVSRPHGRIPTTSTDSVSTSSSRGASGSFL